MLMFESFLNKQNNEKKILFLDDERNPIDCIKFMKEKVYNDNWVIVRTYEEFVKYIKNNGLPKLISFDHDLGEKKTGYDCAKWLINYCLDSNKNLPSFLVHSRNPVGNENITKLLNNFNKYN